MTNVLGGMRISADMVKRRFVQVLLCLSLMSPSLALILSPDTPVLAAPDRLATAILTCVDSIETGVER